MRAWIGNESEDCPRSAERKKRITLGRDLNRLVASPGKSLSLTGAAQSVTPDLEFQVVHVAWHLFQSVAKMGAGRTGSEESFTQSGRPVAEGKEIAVDVYGTRVV